MRHLGRKGDHLVVAVCRRDREAAEPGRAQKLLHAAQKLDIVKIRRHDDHRGIVIEVRPRVAETGSRNASAAMPSKTPERMAFAVMDTLLMDQPAR